MIWVKVPKNLEFSQRNNKSSSAPGIMKHNGNIAESANLFIHLFILSLTQIRKKFPILTHLLMTIWGRWYLPFNSYKIMHMFYIVF